jgi:hypothetical protein
LEVRPSTGERAAFLNNPRSKFAQMAKDCLFETLLSWQAGFAVAVSTSVRQPKPFGRSNRPQGGSALRRASGHMNRRGIVALRLYQRARDQTHSSQSL